MNFVDWAATTFVVGILIVVMTLLSLITGIALWQVVQIMLGPA